MIYIYYLLLDLILGTAAIVVNFGILSGLLHMKRPFLYI